MRHVFCTYAQQYRGIVREVNNMLNMEEVIPALKIKHELDQKDNVITQLRNQITEMSNALTQKDNVISQKDNEISQQNNVISQQNNVISRLQQQLSLK